MTKENLLKYLRDPAYLHQISYQELKTQVAEHPNSLSLRYLLAIKSKQENNGEYMRQLNFLATYGIDRSHLYDVFNNNDIVNTLPEGIVLEEDYLELKKLSTLERTFDEVVANTSNTVIFDVAPVEEEEELSLDLAAPTASDGNYYILDFEEEVIEDPTETVQISEQIEDNLLEIENLFKDIEEEAVINAEPEKTTADKEAIVLEERIKEETIDIENKTKEEEINEAIIGLENPVDAAEAINPIKEETTETEPEAVSITEPETIDFEVVDTTIIPAIEEESLAINPIPKRNFTTWNRTDKNTSKFDGFDLIGYNSKGLISELLETKEKENIKNVPPKTEQEVPISIEEDIASETLAQLLKEQGHYVKARAMYEQLSLIYPQKSSFFAARIEEIELLEQGIKNNE